MLKGKKRIGVCAALPGGACGLCCYSQPMTRGIGREATVAKCMPHTYIVKPGDTRFRIARQYYGDGSKWTKVQKANPQITDPGRLKIGEKLTIPG